MDTKIIKFYQSIPELGIKGRFDMEDQFEAIGLPKDLTGKTVLDMGCNIGAFLIEALKRGASKCIGVELNPVWRYLGNGIMQELDVPIRIYSKIPYEDKFDVVLLLSVTHVAEGISGQQLLDHCYNMTNKLLIVEVNDRLQKEELVLPKGAVFYGKNKNDRSVYTFTKNDLQ